MSNYLQYHQKMAEYRLHALFGMKDDMLEKHLTQLANEFGSVRRLTRLGTRDSASKVYVICFDSSHAAEQAAYSLSGKQVAEDAVMVNMH